MYRFRQLSDSKHCKNLLYILFEPEKKSLNIVKKYGIRTGKCLEHTSELEPKTIQENSGNRIIEKTHTIMKEIHIPYDIKSYILEFRVYPFDAPISKITPTHFLMPNLHMMKKWLKTVFRA